MSRDADQLKLRALAEKQLNREVRVALCAAADEIEPLQAVEAAFERLRAGSTMPTDPAWLVGGLSVEGVSAKPLAENTSESD